jgi:ligand-binding SRPBCC domain-containing protein
MPTNNLISFVFRSAMPASAEVVYRWHARPDALSLLQTPWEKAQVISRTGGIEDLGSRTTIRISVGPFKKNWVAEHVACESGHMFRDVMRSGPFRRWEHTHLFLQDPENLLASWLEDRIEYQLAFGWLGQLVAGKWTGGKLQKMFAYRHRVTALAVASLQRNRQR